MLARLESTYLNILRVVILVAATVALIVTVSAVILTTPYLLSKAGIAGNPDTLNLAGFIQEQRSLGKNVSVPGNNAEVATGMGASSSLHSSATRVVAYANKHHSANWNVADIEPQMMASVEQLPIQYRSAYERSLEALTKELEASKGTPLSLDKLNELLYRHHSDFFRSAAEKEANQSQDLINAITAIGTAAGAFLAFIFLAFCFLFVRIERNLRIVHIAHEGPSNAT